MADTPSGVWRSKFKRCQDGASLLDAASVLLAQAAGLWLQRFHGIGKSPSFWLKFFCLAPALDDASRPWSNRQQSGECEHPRRANTRNLGLEFFAPRRSRTSVTRIWESQAFIARTRRLLELTTNGSIRESNRWYGASAPLRSKQIGESFGHP